MTALAACLGALGALAILLGVAVLAWVWRDAPHVAEAREAGDGAIAVFAIGVLCLVTALKLLGIA